MPSTGAILEPVNGYEAWTITNPDTNANAVFYNTKTNATVTATQSKAIRPGQQVVIFVDRESQKNGVSLLAATAQTTVIIEKEFFRSRLLFQIGKWAAAVATAVAISFWRLVSGSTTAIEPVGGVTEVRGDTIRNKTAGATMALTTQAATDPILIGAGSGTASQAILRQSASGPAIVSTATATSLESAAGVSAINITSAEVQHRQVGTTPDVYYNASGADARHTMNATNLVHHTPSSGGVIDSVKRCYELPIANTIVVAPGDTVEFVNNTNNRVGPSAIGSAQIILGIAITGGTGNAGGTVFCRVAVEGWLTGVIADTGGVTVLQYIKPGANNANRVISTTALAVNSFGRCTLTAAATNPTSFMLCRA